MSTISVISPLPVTVMIGSDGTLPGFCIPYAFEVFPHSVANAYRLISDSRDILAITRESVVTKGAGEGVLKVIDVDGKICEEKVISVVARSFVSSIRLMPNFKSLQEGQKGKIDAYVLPETAEDAKSVTWQSSDSDTVHVTGSGEVIALKPGRAKITASCQKCSAAIEVEVCPALENITLSSSDITVEVGKTHTITCNLHPQNAAHGEIIWELDNDGLGTIMPTNEGRVCQFTATTSSLAKGNLKCRVKGSSKSAVCSISIVPEDSLRAEVMAIDIDEEHIEGEYLLGTVSNTTSIGGILRFDSDEVKLNDGYLELLLVSKPSTTREFAQIVQALNTRSYSDCSCITYRKSKHVRIISHNQIPWTLDGECAEESNYVEIENIPNAIHVMVPRK